MAIDVRATVHVVTHLRLKIKQSRQSYNLLRFLMLS